MASGRVPSGRQWQGRGANTQPKVTMLRPQTQDDNVEIPKLPYREGNPYNRMTLRWWQDVWASPMALEYTTADHHGLFRLAQIVDLFWDDVSSTDKIKMLAEIRLQSAAFGLSPIDRSRLRWEMEKGEEAEGRTKQRRTAAAPAGPAAVDPRSTLRA